MSHRLFPMLLMPLLLVLLHCAPTSAAEAILDYSVLIQVQDDASLEVTEHITVRAEGRNIRRGIYRDFPTRYRDRAGNAVVVDLDVLGVERNGQPEPWFTERMFNGIRINTGNDDYLPAPAEHRYTLRYRTTRQIGFFETHDELYFNAIAQDWMFPIQAASVEVRLPQPVPTGEMNAEAYTGPQGAQGRDYRVELLEPGVARWVATRRFPAHAGMTIVLGFPKGLLPEPTTAQRLWWLLKDNRGVLIALAGLLVLLVYCVRTWRRIGRDPAKGVVFARYEPPAGFSPAGLRFMNRRSYDSRCFTADVLDMAVKGELRINRKKRLLSDAWSLERLAPAPRDGDRAGRDPAQDKLLNALFTSRRSKLDLHKRNATTLQACNQAHSKALDQRFHPRYFKRNGGSIGIALLIATVAAIAAFMLSGGTGMLLIGMVVALMMVTVITFAILVQAPTPEGRRLLDEIEGLKLYLGVAERDDLKNLQGPDAPPELDAGRYEQLLPYAVALDVEDAWTKKFTLTVGVAAAAAATGAIAWYRGGGVDSLGGLSKAVGSSLSSAIASSSTPPGSSSGGGGGGSSGGGGGGGGGGGR